MSGLAGMLKLFRHPAKVSCMRGFGAALLVASHFVASCSSDAGPAPDPEVKQPGAFVAFGQGELTLMRTLEALSLDNDTALFSTIYDVTPTSFEEARALAQQPSLPIRQSLATGSEKLLQLVPHRVVWFRTLTRAERDLGL
jgi:hypothetical protein